MRTQLDTTAGRISGGHPQAPAPTAKTSQASSSAAHEATEGLTSRPRPSSGDTGSSSVPPRKSLAQLRLDSPPRTPHSEITEVPAGTSRLSAHVTAQAPLPKRAPTLESFKNDAGELTPEAVKLLKSALPHGGSAIEKLVEREARRRPKSLSDRLLNKLHGEPQPLKGERFAKFMVMAQSDVQAVAKRTKLSLHDAAELMRLGLSQAGLDKKLTSYGDKARMLYALYGIREKHAAQEILANTMAHHPKFKGLPAGDAWRMVMDHKVWGDGKHQGLRFENEPGYMGGMFRGLAALIQADLEGRRFDARLLGELHAHCTTGVVKQWNIDMLDALPPDDFPTIEAFTARRAEDQGAGLDRGEDNHLPIFVQGYRNRTTASFVMEAGVHLTEAGFREMVANYNHSDTNRMFYLYSVRRGQVPEPVRRDMEYSDLRAIQLRAASIPNLEAAADYIIRRDGRQIESAAPGDDKLRAIARSCQALERSHVFEDGNARTVGFLVLNKLLLENGMVPAMFEDPNRFDGFSSDELVDEIKRGQATFARYAGQPGSAASAG